MVIDAHTHTFPEKIADGVIANLQQKAQSRAYTRGTDRALQQSMRQAGIDISILLPVATNSRQVQKLNDIAAEKNAVYRQSGLFSLGCMHPDYENYAAELSRIAANGITGIKLHPAYQGVDLDDLRFMKIIDKACECGLAIVIHAGWDIGIMHHNFASAAQIESVLREIAPDKFVLAHMGGWKDWDTVEQELCGENVYLDTSFSLGAYVPPSGCTVPFEKRQMLSTTQFSAMLEKHGADKILFGSDSPWSDQTQSLATIKSCVTDNEALERILYRNAKAVFGI